MQNPEENHHPEENHRGSAIRPPPATVVVNCTKNDPEGIYHSSTTDSDHRGRSRYCRSNVDDGHVSVDIADPTGIGLHGRSIAS